MGACISSKACGCGSLSLRARSHNSRSNASPSANSECANNGVTLTRDSNYPSLPVTNHASTTSLENSNLASTTNNMTTNNNGSENGSLNNLASTINTSSSSNAALIGTALTSPSYYASSGQNDNGTGSPFVPPTGKNRKLRKDFARSFKLDRRITEAQLSAKREEFWDTAPAFEGKAEIWAALRAAVEACEQRNYQLAQVIVDSASIILPRGFLDDCYDELGNRYQIPVYVLARPVGMGRKGSGQLDVREDEDDDEDEIDDFNLNSLSIQNTKSNFFKNKLRFSKVKNNASNLIGSTSFSFETKKRKLSKEAETPPAPNNPQRSNSVDDLFQIKVRMSNMAYSENELKVRVAATQTVRQLKRQVEEASGVSGERQRMFFGGKLLRDRQQLQVHRLRRNVVVQVIVRDAKSVSSQQVTQVL